MQLKLFDAPADPTFISRVILRNFRSIGVCDVALGPLTYLVGENGAGKSNFLDGLRLITDALTTSLDHALRGRGGIQEVRRRSAGHPRHFGIRLELRLPDGTQGSFAFEVGARPHGEFVVGREECAIGAHKYEVREGKVVHTTVPVHPPASDDRLYLVNAAGLPEFRPAYEALIRMGFYNVDPSRIRSPQDPDKGDLLARDGANLASVVARLRRTSPEVKKRIDEFLGRVVPGLSGFERAAIGHMETLHFMQQVEGESAPWRFPAINMSDGTLRVAALLTALFQSDPESAVRLVGIEEPETALHPAAAGVLRDCIKEASRRVQVLVTSHSGELLDDAQIQPEVLKAVASQGGTTVIADLDPASRDAVRDRLYTPGELLRLNQLAPDLDKVPRARQTELFGVLGPFGEP